MSSSESEKDESVTPTTRILKLENADEWLVDFANECKARLQLPSAPEMTQELIEKAGKLFTDEYLKRLDPRIVFPQGEKGIHDLQVLISRTLKLLINQPKLDMTIINGFVKHVMNAYGPLLSPPPEESLVPIQPLANAVADAFAARIRNANDAALRATYFAAISSFGLSVAPHIAYDASTRNTSFHDSASSFIEQIDQATLERCDERLNDAAKNRVLTAILIGLETMRQKKISEVADDTEKITFDANTQMRGTLVRYHENKDTKKRE